MTEIKSLPCSFSLSSAASLLPMDNERAWNENKIKQVALYTLTGISLVTAGIALTISPTASLGTGIALIIASGTFYYVASRVVDYEDPDTLAALRCKALTLPLPELLKKHGWENLTAYSILEQKDFESAYRNYVNGLSFHEIVSFFKEAQRSLLLVQKEAAYILPSPSEWKNKFDAEISNISCDEIIKAYSIKDMKAFDLVTPAQIAILEKVDNAIREFKREELDLDKQFIERTHDERVLFQDLREGAMLSYRLHPSHHNLEQIVADTDIAIGFCKSNARALIQQEEQSLEYFKVQLNALRNQNLTPDDLKDIASREAIKSNAIQGIRDHEAETLNRIRNQANIRKIPLEKALSFAKEQRDKQINQAQERFDSHIRPIRNEIDDMQEKNKQLFHKKIDELSQAFRAAV